MDCMHICPHCSKEFSTGPKLGGHVVRCVLNPKFSEYTKKRTDAYRAKLTTAERIKYCKKCGKAFTVTCTEERFSKTSSHCSHRCANTKPCVTKLITVPCAQCSTLVEVNNRLSKEDRICQKCRDLRTWSNRSCLICGKRLKNIQKSYCSKQCSGKKIISAEVRSKLRVSAIKTGLGGNRRKSAYGIYSSPSAGEVYLESSYEYLLADYLDRHNIQWSRPKYFKYILDNKPRKYYPDFYLPELDVYLDPKNDYLLKIDAVKLQAVRNQCNIKLFTVSKAELDNLDEFFKLLPCISVGREPDC